MSENSRQPLESSGGAPPLERPRGKRWQFGLRSLVLLVAAIAVWMTFFINRRHNAVLEARIRAMLPLAHELVVDDAKKIAVVKLEEYWSDDNRWDIYLPEGRYRLCLATRGVDDKGVASAAKSIPISASRHRLDLKQKRDGDVWRISVARDGTTVMAVEESKDWYPELGSMGGGQYSLSEQLAVDKPVVLFRRRFMRSIGNGVMTTPDGPTEGLLFWIERVDGPATSQSGHEGERGQRRNGTF